MYYQINKGCKSFGTAEVFSDLQFEIRDKEKIALVGRNGSGKTTLMKIIAGELELDSGDIHKGKEIRIGYLAQTTFSNDNVTVEEELLSYTKKYMI